MTFPFRFHIFAPRVRFQSKRLQPNTEKEQNFSYFPTLDYRKFGEKDSQLRQPGCLQQAMGCVNLSHAARENH